MYSVFEANYYLVIVIILIIIIKLIIITKLKSILNEQYFNHCQHNVH